MKLFHSLCRLEQEPEDVASTAPGETKLVFRNIGFLSAGITVLALSVVVGRELRKRYKFNHRTPYDIYGHAGDYMHDVEGGVGI